MPSTLLSQATETQLKQQYDQAEKAIKKAEAIQDGILDELLLRHETDFRSKLAAQQKEGGSLSDSKNGVDINFKIDKKVTWDQEALEKILEKRPDLFKRIVEVKFSVPEKIFDGLTEGEVIKELKTARTVKWQPAKISFKTEK